MKEAIVFVLVVVIVTSSSVSQASDVVELTEENFDSYVANGVWMVKVFAPWCSHCRKVRPVWEELATLLKEDGIRIGSIDSSRESELVERFEATAFPSFYHLKDGQCREYDGQRTLESFATFAKSGYTSVEPLPFYKAPNGLVGRFKAHAKKLPSHVVDVYQWLHFEQKFSHLSILAITLSIPVSIGLGLICILDCLHTRTQNRLRPQARPHVD